MKEILHSSVLQELERQKKAREAVVTLLEARREDGVNEINPEQLVKSTVRTLRKLKFEDGYKVSEDSVKRAIWSLADEDLVHFSALNEIVLGRMPRS